jgi:hypothetical protein
VSEIDSEACLFVGECGNVDPTCFNLSTIILRSDHTSNWRDVAQYNRDLLGWIYTEETDWGGCMVTLPGLVALDDVSVLPPAHSASKGLEPQRD